MDAILNFFSGLIDRIGALILIIGDTILSGRDLLAEIPYEEIGRRTRRAGIYTLIFIGVLLAITIAGLWCGYTGHWIWSSWLLAPVIIGFGLLLLFEKLIFASLAVVVFTIKLAALAVVYPGFLAVQLNTWFKKTPAEIRELFELMDKPEGDESHPNQQAWDENWEKVKSDLLDAANEAEKMAQTIFFWTEAAIGFIAFMAIFFFVVAPNSQPVPNELGLDSAIKRIWLEITGSRITLLAVTLAALFTAFAVSRKPTTGAINQ